MYVTNVGSPKENLVAKQLSTYVLQCCPWHPALMQERDHLPKSHNRTRTTRLNAHRPLPARKVKLPVELTFD